ncbi:hypothetical protein K439DRAFT_1620808 [Ramaria rubella]|nr:hypothetical protein K439DRAFT_1620808 [Ramaria rubella]
MKKKVFKWANTLQLVTVLEAVSTDGTAVPALMVLPGSKELSEWWADTPEGMGSVVCTPNGWTDNEVYLGGFKKIFLPYATSRNTSGKPILSITDSHKSHEMRELMETAFKKDVLLFCLPPHTTDHLQPLDIGVFGPLQKNWAHRSQECSAKGAPIDPISAVREYINVHEKSMTAKCIHSAFRKTGIHPFNPNLFTDEDYTLSGAWDVTDRGPEGYPHVSSLLESAHMTEDDTSPGDSPESGQNGMPAVSPPETGDTGTSGNPHGTPAGNAQQARNMQMAVCGQGNVTRGSTMQVDDDSSDSSSSDDDSSDSSSSDDDSSDSSSSDDDDVDTDSDTDSSSSSNDDPDQHHGDSPCWMNVDSVMAAMNISTQQNGVDDPVNDSVNSKETDPMDKSYVPPPERPLAPGGLANEDVTVLISSMGAALGVPLPPSSVATDEVALSLSIVHTHMPTAAFSAPPPSDPKFCMQEIQTL